MPSPWDIPAIDITRRAEERLRERRLARAVTIFGRELHWTGPGRAG